MSFEEFEELSGTGFQGGGGNQKPQVAPEDEMFHSLYIAAVNRPNHINVTELADKLQIRGVQYNLDEVNMIITHTKDILVQTEKDRKTQKDIIKCFSYKDGAPPWQGSSKMPNGQNRVCPQTSADRAVSDFCSPCRAQIIVAGIYCKPDGTPILNEESKPHFIFLRGKGMKYSNVSEYLNNLYKEEGFSPLFQPSTPQTLEFEKSVVNNKRIVTKITCSKERTSYGSMANVFVLSRGIQIPNESVLGILKLSKGTMSKFNDKFDWSKSKAASASKNIPDGVLTIEDKKSESKETSKQTPVPEKVFNFDDIKY